MIVTTEKASPKNDMRKTVEKEEPEGRPGRTKGRSRGAERQSSCPSSPSKTVQVEEPENTKKVTPNLTEISLLQYNYSTSIRDEHPRAHST